jgi:hypothetical protein
LEIPLLRQLDAVLPLDVAPKRSLPPWGVRRNVNKNVKRSTLSRRPRSLSETTFLLRQ